MHGLHSYDMKMNSYMLLLISLIFPLIYRKSLVVTVMIVWVDLTLTNPEDQGRPRLQQDRLDLVCHLCHRLLVRK